MNLRKYDSKLVQIECIDGKTYEGICEYNNQEYCYHEFGREEDSLEISYILFYKSDINRIKIIPSFTDPFGEIEKEIFEEGIVFIEQVFESEENVHIYRLLCYLETKKLDNDLSVSKSIFL